MSFYLLASIAVFASAFALGSREDLVMRVAGAIVAALFWPVGLVVVAVIAVYEIPGEIVRRWRR